MTDDGEVLACPECDKTPVVTNSTGGRSGGDCSKYRCPTCNAHFDEATVREDRGGPGIRDDSLAAKLEDAVPGDLVTDGGVDQSEAVTEQLSEAKITTNGGQPAVELPNGERFTLDIHINQTDAEVGEQAVDFDTEVYTDEFSWWNLSTDDGLEISIMPQVGWHDAE